MEKLQLTRLFLVFVLQSLEELVADVCLPDCYVIALHDRLFGAHMCDMLLEGDVLLID